MSLPQIRYNQDKSISKRDETVNRLFHEHENSQNIARSIQIKITAVTTQIDKIIKEREMRSRNGMRARKKGCCKERLHAWLYMVTCLQEQRSKLSIVP